MSAPARRMVTPPAYAAELGIDVRKVLGWIRSGELRAINLAAHPRGRPRWSIDRADIADFEHRRAASAPALAKKRRSKPKIEYV